MMDDMAEFAGRSDSDDCSVAGTKIPSESHVRFFTGHFENSRHVTKLKRRSTSRSTFRQRGARQNFTDSEICFVLSSPLDVDFEAAFVKKRKLNADEGRKSPAPVARTKKAVTDLKITLAQTHNTKTAGTSARHKKIGGGSGRGERCEQG